MKKFLSLTVALAMTVAMVPATAFAKSDMKISRQITAESNDLIYDGSTTLQGQTKVTRDAPYLTLKADGSFKSPTQTFRLKLTNAEWLDEKDSTGKTVNFETQGAARTTVLDTNGNSLIDGTVEPSNNLKALQEKLDALVGTKDEDAAEFSKADFRNALKSETADTASTLYVALDGATSNGAIGNLKYNDTSSKALLKWTTEAVRTKINTAAGDERTAWEAVMTEVGAYNTALKASRAAEVKITDAKKDDVEDKVDTFNAAVLDLGITDIEMKLATFDAYVTGEMAKGISVATILTNLKDDAKEDTKVIFPPSAGGISYDDERDALVDDALVATTSYYALIEAAKPLTNVTNASLNIIDNKVALFNTAIGGSTGTAVQLDAQKVVDAYNKVSGNLNKFRDYLTTTGKITVAADQDAVIELVKAVVAGGVSTLALAPGEKGKVTIERVTDTLAMITVETSSALPDDAEVTIPLYTKITGGETATVEVDPRDSEFSSDSKTFAKVSEGSTTSFVDSTKNFYDGDTLNTIYIDENAAGTFEKAKEITLKLSSGFEWGDTTAALQTNGKIKMLNGGSLTIDYTSIKVDGNEVTFKLLGGPSSNPATISLNNMIIKEDGADFGTTAKVTVSGAGITKKLVELGTYSDFGLTLTAESKALPLIYAGSYDDDNETLKATFEETVQSSWLTDRKTEFTFPDDVKIVDIEVKKVDNINLSATDLEQLLRDNIDGNKTTIPARKINVTDNKKAKFEAIYTITADPTFTGDVELSVGGPGIGSEKLSKAIATVASPLTVKSTVNEVKIDYRNVAVNSITITEAEAGLWEKGDKITLDVEEMQFESGITAEVVSGDMKLEKLDGDNVQVSKKAGTVTIQVKSTSSSTPAEIKIDGIKLYLDRSLPVGDYELSIITTADDKEKPEFNKKEKDLLFANYSAITKDFGDKFGQTAFDTDSVVVLKDFVKVVTAGRDQGDGFTTQLIVPVGSDKIIAGTNEITIDAPAYINADGYTMLPVRAVIDALNGIAVVRWDDASKTCTISYANKVFAMTVGSKTMNMNGVATALLAAPEIKNERIFLPLRDLGYALGLSDSKIVWDASTNTATLNPIAGSTTPAPANVTPVAPAATPATVPATDATTPATPAV